MNMYMFVYIYFLQGMYMHHYSTELYRCTCLCVFARHYTRIPVSREMPSSKSTNCSAEVKADACPASIKAATFASMKGRLAARKEPENLPDDSGNRSK